MTKQAPKTAVGEPEADTAKNPEKEAKMSQMATESGAFETTVKRMLEMPPKPQIQRPAPKKG